ncbi:MAG: peptidoglycan-binding protein [Deltaproteobacteria bacterium]|nr:peptidoglycan-binding protein [Deltaproteobacteria bacterium]
MLRKEEIRVIQVRLKDAGFDPGTVDGISGPNTRAAVARFRAGCGAVKTMPPAVLEAARSMEPDAALALNRTCSQPAIPAMIRVTGLSASIHLPHETIVEELRGQRLLGFRDGVGQEIQDSRNPRLRGSGLRI